MAIINMNHDKLYKIDGNFNLPSYIPEIVNGEKIRVINDSIVIKCFKSHIPYPIKLKEGDYISIEGDDIFALEWKGSHHKVHMVKDSSEGDVSHLW